MGGMRHWLAQSVKLALRPYPCSIPAVILERSEGSKRDYKSKDFAVFTYAGSPNLPIDMRWLWFLCVSANAPLPEGGTY